ncbi:MAG: hypothetical protein UR26_C0009G0007 [candidate division TM6 bacterium GW2011_GWF2_32_72]|jgi:signal transduction histidine kinase|nr:MAG: hypothetical protein UR26_C0009G0007 [candidate division TM6 bacterium GW2011_GWF2_32_72]
MNRYLKYNFVIVFVLTVFYNFIALAPAAKAVVSGMNDSVGVEGFDEKAYSDSRKVDVKNLVDKAVQYFEKNDFGKSMNAFSYSKEFIDGELHLFVYDFNNVCLAHGQDRYLIWQDRTNYKDILGNPVIKMIIDKAKTGSGWINYQKDNATKIVYVKGAQKDGKKYAIGSGFYPLSKKDATVSLVRNAVETFNNVMKSGGSTQAVFSEFSYSLGRFINGDLYLFALDFKGKIVAQGDIPGIIGTSAIDYKDSAGRFINREIIEELQTKDIGIWTEYISKGAKKLTYAEKVIDRDGNKYFIACGYYPDTDRKAVVELVKKGYAYMAKNGAAAASKEFSERTKKDYRNGDLFLVVYDIKGKCIAHGANYDYIGINQWNVKDETGKYPIRQMIDKAKAGGGWVDYKVKNSYMFRYVEEIVVAGEKYVIGCGIFPTSKPETMQLIVKDAAGSIRDLGPEKAFGEFIKRSGKFVKGDLEIFVYDFSGLCLVYGSDYNMVWKDMLTAKDDDGRQYVKLIINTAKDGSGTVIYRDRGRLKTVYVMKVEKDGRSYAVGSSFFIK